jgi:hypothetical protein
MIARDPPLGRSQSAFAVAGAEERPDGADSRLLTLLRDPQGVRRVLELCLAAATLRVQCRQFSVEGVGASCGLGHSVVDGSSGERVTLAAAMRAAHRHAHFLLRQALHFSFGVSRGNFPSLAGAGRGISSARAPFAPQGLPARGPAPIQGTTERQVALTWSHFPKIGPYSLRRIPDLQEFWYSRMHRYWTRRLNECLDVSCSAFTPLCGACR